LNRFLFIVPLTPLAKQTAERKRLQQLCIRSLNSQTYRRWQALMIGEHLPESASGDRFIHVPYEAAKEEKLQYCTHYIRTAGLQSDYVIRLDDDDVINPEILEKLADADFSIYVDLYHSYWRPDVNEVAQTVKQWFPNTFVIKTSLALEPFGTFPPGDHRNLKEKPLLIENEHNVIHEFFVQRKLPVTFAKKSDPVYLRSVAADSLTARQSGDRRSYLKSFGRWRANRLRTFGITAPERGVTSPGPMDFQQWIINLKDGFAFSRKFTQAKVVHKGMLLKH
jgi:hypothetical protein